MHPSLTSGWMIAATKRRARCRSAKAAALADLLTGPSCGRLDAGAGSESLTAAVLDVWLGAVARVTTASSTRRSTVGGHGVPEGDLARGVEARLARGPGQDRACAERGPWPAGAVSGGLGVARDLAEEAVAEAIVDLARVGA